MPELIPFRWPVQWTSPSKLELIKGTPINCLTGEAPPPFPLGELKFVKLDPEQPPEGVTIREGVWPRVLPSEKKDAAEAGPTGSPWVDSSAGVIRLAQAKAPGKTVWLTYQPPGENEVVPFESFVKPVAESESFGAHWVITLSDSFRKALDAGAAQAMDAWKRMMATLEFFSRKAEWRRWQPVAALGVISSYEGEAEILSTEFLNLAPRRHLAYRVLITERLSAKDLEGLTTAIYIESEPPAGELLKLLLAFAESGGLVIAPRGTSKTKYETTRLGYQFHRHGKGWVAVPPDAWYDPYILVREVHLLMSHRQDVVRVWNASDSGSYFVAAADGKRGVVHLVQYGGGRTQPVTIGLARPYRTARIYNLEKEFQVEPVKVELGIEIPVGEFAAYAAVEVEA